MNDFSDLKKALPMIFARPISFHACFGKIAGSAAAGLMLSQACYWTGTLELDREGWFYKSQEEWESELCLTRWEQETARKQLKRKGYLEDDRRGVPARLWYRVRFEKIWTDLTQTSLWENHILDCGKPSNKNDGNPQSLLLTENTTENTTEKKIGKADAFRPPTEGEVAVYMHERGFPHPEHEAELFVAHHANRSWRLGGGRGPAMKDWRKAVITWQGNMEKFNGGRNGQARTESFKDRERRESAAAIQRVAGDTPTTPSDLRRALPPTHP